MAKTLIESRSKVLLAGFELAINFFMEEANTHLFPGGALLVETDDQFEDVTYTLTSEGLQVKHKGVEL